MLVLPGRPPLGGDVLAKQGPGLLQVDFARHDQVVAMAALERPLLGQGALPGQEDAGAALPLAVLLADLVALMRVAGRRGTTGRRCCWTRRSGSGSSPERSGSGSHAMPPATRPPPPCRPRAGPPSPRCCRPPPAAQSPSNREQATPSAIPRASPCVEFAPTALQSAPAWLLLGGGAPGRTPAAPRRPADPELVGSLRDAVAGAVSPMASHGSCCGCWPA